MRLVQRARRYWQYGNPFVKRIAYTGWIGHENFGDEMLFQAHQRLFPDYEVLMFSRFSKKAGALYKKLTRKPVFLAGCLGGGTLINRAGSPTAFSRLIDDCPVAFCLGTGVADSHFWKGREGWEDRLQEWIELLRKCRFVGVRGPMSAQCLRDGGLSGVEVVGDSALVFARDSPCARAEDKLLGINVGTSSGAVWGTEETILSSMTSAGKALRSEGWKLLFLCVWPRDMDVTRELAKQIGVSDPEIHLVTANVEQALNLCERCHVFIGMKLHSVVTAICAGVPSVMIEYRPKCRDFMASIRSEEYTIRSDHLDPDDLVNRLNMLASQRDSVREKICHEVQQLKESLINAASTVDGIIRSASSDRPIGLRQSPKG